MKTKIIKICSFFLIILSLITLVSCNNDEKGKVDDSMTYTVSFDNQGHGVKPENQIVEKGTHATYVKLTDDNYTFGGWFKENDCINLYNFNSEIVNSNITLYAKWEDNVIETTYSITYVSSLGNAPSKIENATEITSAILNSMSDIGDKEFEGWYLDEAYSQKATIGKIDKNITLYAKWIDKIIENNNVTIYLAGDSTVQTYNDSQYIAGWGQYLDLFLDDNISVVNCARGGRSSRSFINEDRLFTSTDGTKYSFSENGGKSIEECIKPNDYLFIQFGHNDDNTKGYTTMPDRMVPLGEPDSQGIYPTTAPSEKKPTTYLPSGYTSLASVEEQTKMLNEITKYGDTYYAYGDGTYKWYLKQYIDLARSKNAIPVLCTPVARVKFDANNKLQSGPGLHGEDFAYVKAVKQLAEEENCLLIDNFLNSKELLETATPTYANFLMAIVPNTLNNGPWPSGYDSAYENTSAGFEKIEATHYNKYGAFLTAAFIAEEILNSKDIKVGNNSNEYFSFLNNILTTPKSFIDPSNRIGISKVSEIEGLFKLVNPTNPNRYYKQPIEAINAINELANKGGISDINSSNYETWKEYCANAREVYESLNYDLRDEVTNYNILVEYETAVSNAKPKPVSTIVLDASNFKDASTPITIEDHTFSFSSEITSYAAKSAQFTYNDNTYSSTTQAIKLPGNANITGNQIKYIEFNVTKKCSITIVASGGGTTTRYIQVANSEKSLVATYNIEPSQTLYTAEINEAGTYRLGSSGSNINIYYIIIEYYE